MQFIDKAPLYRIIRITGPTHNLLGLELSENPTSAKPTIDILDAGDDAPAKLNLDDVLAAVSKGVDAVSGETGKTFWIKRIQFLQSDSRPVEIYTMLAAEILRRVAAGP